MPRRAETGHERWVGGKGGLRGDWKMLWSRTTKNPDVSIEPLARPFAICLHHPACFAPALRCAHSFARLLTPSMWESERLDAGNQAVFNHIEWMELTLSASTENPKTRREEPERSL